MKDEAHAVQGLAGSAFKFLACLLFITAIGQAVLAGDAAPFNWRISSSWPGYMRGNPSGLALNGGMVYVAMEEAGWISFDIADAAHPKSIGFYPYGNSFWAEYWSAAYGIAVVSNRVFVADSEGGLAIFDAANPSSPTLLGRFRHEDEFMDAIWICIEGRYAYLFDEGEKTGLNIINIENPRRPVLVGQLIQDDWNLQALEVANQFVYAVDWDGNLSIIDARDPQQPLITTNMAFGAMDISIFHDRAYVTEEEHGMTILDLGNPAHPSTLGTYDLAGQNGLPESIFALENKAYVTTADSHLLMLDVQDADEPRLLAKTEKLGYLQNLQATRSNLCLLSVKDLQIWELTSTNTLISKAALPLIGDAQAVAISGAQVYLADGKGGMQVLDIADPLHPFLLANVAVAGKVTDVAVSGGLAYLLDPSQGFWIIDISVPAKPRQVGYLDLTNRPSALAVTNQTVYLAAGTNGLIIVDASNPSQPRLSGEFRTEGIIRQVSLSGKLAIVVDQSQGLILIDVTDSSAPRLAGAYPLPSVIDLDVEGNNIYVITTGELLILDFSNPAKPRLLGRLDIFLFPESIEVEKGSAYIASGWRGVEIINVEEAKSPFRVTIQDTPGFANRLRVLGHRIYVADGPLGLILLEPSDLPTQAPVILRPPESMQVAPGETATLRAFVQGAPPLHFQWRKNGINIPGATNAVLTHPNLAVSDGGTYSVVVSNVHGWIESSPALLAPQVSRWQASDDFASAPLTLSPSGTGAADNDWASLEEGEPTHAGKDGRKSLWSQWRPPASGIATLSTSGSGLDTLLAVYIGDELTNLVEVAHDDDRGGYLCSKVQFNALKDTNYHIAVAGYGLNSVHSIAIQGPYALVTDENLGLLVYDLTTPSRPSFVGALPDEDGPYITCVRGSFAYVADYSGLKIIDIQDPAHPKLLGAYDYLGWIEEVDADQDTIYLAAGEDGLIIIDVKDPRNPKQLAHFIPPSPWKGWMEDVKVRDSYVFVADWDGLFILDMSNPASPQLVSQTPISDMSFAMSLQVVGDYAFVTSDYPALQVFDIRDRSKPEKVGFLELPPTTTYTDNLSMQIRENYAFITDAQGGTVLVIDISEPEEPLLKSAYKTGGYAMDIDVRQGYAYVAAGFSGLRVLDISDSTNLRPVGGVSGSFGNIVVSWNLEVTEERLPVISIQPQPRTLALLGDRVELSIQAEPSASTFQWFFNGQPIPGAAQSNLLRSPIIPRDAGTYRVMTTAPNGRFIDSDDAQVEVTTSRSLELEVESAYKFADLFLPSKQAAPMLSRLAAAPNQGTVGSRWSASPEWELPPVSFPEQGIVATAPRWFVFKPRLSNLCSLNTVGSEFPTLLAVFTNRFALGLAAWNIPEPDQKDAFLKMPVEFGQEYFILVASLDGTKGSIQLNLGAPALTELAFDFYTAQVLQGQFFLSVPRLVGRYSLETSSALTPGADWLFVTNVHCLGRLDFLDPEPPSRNAKFYRIQPAP